MASRRSKRSDSRKKRTNAAHHPTGDPEAEKFGGEDQDERLEEEDDGDDE